MYYDRTEDNLNQTLKASKKALELDPDLAESHTSRAIALFQNNQYEEAEKEFKAAIQLNSKLYQAYYQKTIEKPVSELESSQSKDKKGEEQHLLPAEPVAEGAHCENADNTGRLKKRQGDACQPDIAALPAD